MSWGALVVELLRAFAAWFRYTYSPEMVERRDAINLELMKGKNREEVDQIFGGKDTIGLGYFLNESLRILRAQKTDPAPGWEANLPDRILLRPRDEKSKTEDHTEGPDLG
jgi:hypothetical protein